MISVRVSEITSYVIRVNELNTINIRVNEVETVRVNITDAIPGAKGEPFLFEDFTPEQLESIKGEKGDSFQYSDFTPEQLESLKGEKGDAFEYSDFTSEQLAALKGEKGDPQTKEGLGLGNVDNTADINKPLSQPQLDAIYRISNYFIDNLIDSANTFAWLRLDKPLARIVDSNNYMSDWLDYTEKLRKDNAMAGGIPFGSSDVWSKTGDITLTRITDDYLYPSMPFSIQYTSGTSGVFYPLIKYYRGHNETFEFSFFAKSISGSNDLVISNAWPSYHVILNNSWTKYKFIKGLGSIYFSYVGQFQFSLAATGVFRITSVELNVIKGNSFYQYTAVNQPIYSNGYLAFDGTNDYLQCQYRHSADIGSIYIVAKRIGTDASFQVYETLTNIGYSDGGVVYIGRNLSGNYYNIQIKEVILRNQTDSSDERNLIISYLKNKFSIA